MAWMRNAAVFTCLLIAVTACSEASTVAVVDGALIERVELDALHGRSVTDDERASSLYLLILHRVLVAGAQRDFGVTVSEDQLDTAFAARTGRLGSDVDGALAASGWTRARVMLEAELDVIRDLLEEGIVRSGWPGVDLDGAYRDFLAVNSRACLVVLTVRDPALADDVERRVEDGEGLEDVFAAYPDRTARTDRGCRSPLQHGGELGSVALDGEVGRSYLRYQESGDPYLALVTERQAPTAEEVRDEVIEVAIERQGPDLFTQWAAGLLRAAEVEISADIGRWGPRPETGDLPTVIVGSR